MKNLFRKVTKEDSPKSRTISSSPPRSKSPIALERPENVPRLDGLKANPEQSRNPGSPGSPLQARANGDLLRQRRATLRRSQFSLEAVTSSGDDQDAKNVTLIVSIN